MKLGLYVVYVKLGQYVNVIGLCLWDINGTPKNKSLEAMQIFKVCNRISFCFPVRLISDFNLWKIFFLPYFIMEFILFSLFNLHIFCCYFIISRVNLYQGIGNGLPLGAVVTTPEIASVMAQKIQFNTFGGNPVCSAGGLAVLRVLDKEKRQAHCADVGSYLLERLRFLMERHDSMLS